MVNMLRYHFVIDGFALRNEVRITHLFDAEAACVILLPNQPTLLVAQVQEALIVWIMARPDGIHAHSFHELQIADHERKRQRRSGQGMIFMTIEPLQEDGLAIKQNRAFPRFERPGSRPALPNRQRAPSLPAASAPAATRIAEASSPTKG